jgi:hypothetical protein
MNASVDNRPIFIHSLFRSGSTYLFKAFRRSGEGYWCYQEAVHEIAFFSRTDPSFLHKDHGEAKEKLLRHPSLDGSYFKELQEVWPAWKDTITEHTIYNEYFEKSPSSAAVSYFRSLIEAAKGRPVFQECRTAGRIETIKQQLGGYHIYLWRNPWDQWWSTKVDPYFDVSLQLLIHAKNPPSPVQQLLSTLKLPSYDASDLVGGFEFYREKPLTSEQGYLVFYLLWCLALNAALKSANLLLNIDKLTDSARYRASIVDQLRQDGIFGIDFSDCQIPQAAYLEQDQTFFESLQEKVHGWLIGGGWSLETLKKLLAVQGQHQPSLMRKSRKPSLATKLAEQACRARALSCRFETRASTSALSARNFAAAAHAEKELLTAEKDKVGVELSAARTMLDQRAEDLGAARAEKEALVAEREKTETELAEARTKLEQAAGELGAARAEKEALAADRERVGAELAAAHARLEQMAGELGAVRAGKEALEVALAHQTTVAQHLSAERDALREKSESSAVSLQQAQKSLEDTTQELHHIHQSNHHHLQLAEQRQHRIDDLLKSTCWRITAPLRWCRRLFAGKTQRNIEESLVNTFLTHSALYIRRRPYLKQRALGLLFRYPALHSRVLPVLRKIHSVGNPADHASGTSFELSANGVTSEQNLKQIDDLTSHARRIYEQLRSFQGRIQ